MKVWWVGVLDGTPEVSHVLSLICYQPRMVLCIFATVNWKHSQSLKPLSWVQVLLQKSVLARRVLLH